MHDFYLLNQSMPTIYF